MIKKQKKKLKNRKTNWEGDPTTCANGEWGGLHFSSDESGRDDSVWTCSRDGWRRSHVFSRCCLGNTNGWTEFFHLVWFGGHFVPFRLTILYYICVRNYLSHAPSLCHGGRRGRGRRTHLSGRSATFARHGQVVRQSHRLVRSRPAVRHDDRGRVVLGRSAHTRRISYDVVIN